MITGELKSQIDRLLDAFWTGVTSNPLTVIEQITYLIFIRRLDDIETKNERVAQLSGKEMERRLFSTDQQHLRWSQFKQLKSDEMLQVVRDGVFPFIKTDLINTDKNSGVNVFARQMENATFLIQKPSVLSTAVSLISDLDLDDADTAGDLYEYLLLQLSSAGKNGQFRTPRHIIRMMTELMDPSNGERICDPACGTGGFLFTALNYLLEKYTSPERIQVAEDGTRHGFVGDAMTEEQRKCFKTDTFYGFDFEHSMLQLASMNMWLHGIETPHIQYADSLSKNFEEESRYDVILANPPFKGSLDYDDCNPSLLAEVKTKKTELLFLALALRLLNTGGRAAIIVPDGVLFGSSIAHVGIRKTLVEDHQLEGIISMPSGVFKPYAGVSTAVLIFTKGGETDRVWFYDMEHDGLSLDDKRQPVTENDIPDILKNWKQREDQAHQGKQQERMDALKTAMAPLKQERLKYHELLNRLQFEQVLNEADVALEAELKAAQENLKNLDERIHELQHEFNQLSRQFWVTKADIQGNKYDLSASRYRQIEQDETYYPEPQVTLKRMGQLEDAINKQIQELEALIK
ncbi:MAG: N-6 DNA methylase [Cyanobacteria bacterium]|nr:N-6 DNA methylase [Cyanobacteriota bacterium]